MNSPLCHYVTPSTARSLGIFVPWKQLICSRTSLVTVFAWRRSGKPDLTGQNDTEADQSGPGWSAGGGRTSWRLLAQLVGAEVTARQPRVLGLSSWRRSTAAAANPLDCARAAPSPCITHHTLQGLGLATASQSDLGQKAPWHGAPTMVEGPACCKKQGLPAPRLSCKDPHLLRW